MLKKPNIFLPHQSGWSLSKSRQDGGSGAEDLLDPLQVHLLGVDLYHLRDLSYEQLMQL